MLDYTKEDKQAVLFTILAATVIMVVLFVTPSNIQGSNGSKISMYKKLKRMMNSFIERQKIIIMAALRLDEEDESLLPTVSEICVYPGKLRWMKIYLICSSAIK